MSKVPLGRLLSGFFALSLLLFCAVEATAQTTARVEGTVTDGTGAPLPGVTVSATNTRTNAVRTDVSDSHGAYTITALTVGEDKISAELSGLQSQVTPLTLTVGQVARVDFKLTVGNVSEAITVTAAAPPGERDPPENSNRIDS